MADKSTKKRGMLPVIERPGENVGFSSRTVTSRNNEAILNEKTRGYADPADVRGAFKEISELKGFSSSDASPKFKKKMVQIFKDRASQSANTGPMKEVKFTYGPRK